MGQPELYTASRLQSWDVAMQLPNGRYIPARPEGHNLYSFAHRVKIAFRVFTGQYDAVDWDPAIAGDNPAERQQGKFNRDERGWEF